MERVYLKVRRKDGPDGLSYWEEFAVPYEPGMTVTAALMAVREDPFTADGLPTSPVVWEQNCLEEVCGSCAMVINGKVRQACSAVVDDLAQPIVLEPMAAFPAVRDLRVDRSSMREALGGFTSWVELDGFGDQGFARARSEAERAALYPLSLCIACGCCMEACPQVNDRSPYLGAFLMAQVMYLHRRDPSVGSRLDAMKAPGGIAGCDNAQNCEAVCPKDIPLGEVMARMQWDVLKHSLVGFLRG